MSAHPPYFANVEIMRLDPNDIIVGARIGFLHPEKVEALGRMMVTDGQQTPILVSKVKGKDKYRLVAGLHRLEGAKAEKIEVSALEIFGDEADLRAIEASENMHRRDFGPIERACFINAVAENAKVRAGVADLSPQEAAIKARWDRVQAKVEGFVADEEIADADGDYTRVMMTRVYGWRDEVAAAMGISPETVKRDLAIYRGIVALSPKLAEPLSRHPTVGGNAAALRKIVAVKDRAARLNIITDLAMDHDRLLEAVLERWTGKAKAAPVTGAAKFTSAIVSNWSRLSANEQRAFLPDLVDLLTPAMRNNLREMLTEKDA